MTTLRRRLYTILATTAGITTVTVLTAPSASAGFALGNHCEPLLGDH
jgi:hypothetical protein